MSEMYDNRERQVANGSQWIGCELIGAKVWKQLLPADLKQRTDPVGSDHHPVCVELLFAWDDDDDGDDDDDDVK